MAKLLANPKVRWTVAAITALFLLIFTFLIIFFEFDDFEIQPAPELHLTLREIKIPEEPKPVVAPKPKPKPKPKKRVQKKKVIPKEPVKESPIAEKVVEEPVVEEVVEEPVTEEVVDEPVVEDIPQPPTRIGSADQLDNSNFSPIYNPKPAYPVIARRAGIEGYIDIDLTINEEGRIDKYNIEKVFGHQSFRTELEKVIMKWRFPPPRMNGKKRKVKYLYRVNFTLH